MFKTQRKKLTHLQLHTIIITSNQKNIWSLLYLSSIYHHQNPNPDHICTTRTLLDNITAKYQHTQLHLVITPVSTIIITIPSLNSESGFVKHPLINLNVKSTGSSTSPRIYILEIKPKWNRYQFSPPWRWPKPEKNCFINLPCHRHLQRSGNALTSAGGINIQRRRRIFSEISPRPFRRRGQLSMSRPIRVR